MVFLTQNNSRQREILEVVFRNGWDYMRRLLTVGKAESPELPTPTVLRNILVDLGPVYVKFGQLLSTRPDIIPPDYIEALTALQANVPPVSWSNIETLLREQLKVPVDQVFAEFNREAVAAGSIAQTHRATLLNGQEVAVKVQRPGIDQIVEQDISLIKSLAELVARTDFGEDYDVVSLAEEFTNALRAELDFTQEASYTDQLRRNVQNSNWYDPKQVVIPAINWEVTTPKIMVMEWLDGSPILSAKLPKAQEEKIRQEVTTLLFRVFFKQIYIDGFFHADPHPGNVFYLDNGQLALIDCGMIGRLDPRTQQVLTEMLLAIIDIDAQRCSQLTLELSESSSEVNLTNLENDYERMLRKYYNLSISQINFSEVFYEILEVSRNNKVKLPSNMGLYAKSLANLEGVARGFNPDVNLLNEVRPLMTDLFRNQILGNNPIPTLLRTTLDLKSLSLQGPRQMELLLDRVTSETLSWNLNIRELDPLRRSIDDSANRLSFSVIVGSLIMGAAIISSNAQTPQLSLISNILFATASFIGFWLLLSIWRSGRLK